MKLKSKLICAGSLLPLIFSIQAAADNVIRDDLIVTGSQCVGLGCAEGEEFDFDTLKLKSDNPQIRFEDTSTTAAFPSSDWSMGIADGVTDTSFFYINDVNTATTVLKLSGSASGGVALGAGAELEDNVVSVGSAGAERQIKHVAAGTEGTDAVNVGQFEVFQTVIEGGAVADIATFNTELTGLENQMSLLTTRLEELLTRVDSL